MQRDNVSYVGNAAVTWRSGESGVTSAANISGSGISGNVGGSS